jgi:predicted permease
VTRDGDMPNGPPGRRRRPFRLDAGPHRVERDVDAELEFHLAMRARRLVDAGLDPAAARARALDQFGDLGAVRAEVLTIDRERERAMRRTIRLEDLRQDAAYAVRSLRHRKGFVATLLAILALGIGANAATFALVDALLLRALPVPHPEQLVTVGDPTRTGSLSEGSPRTDLLSYPLYVDVRDGVRAFRGVYASGRAGRLDAFIDRAPGGGVAAGAEPEHPRGRFVSGSYWSVLQVPAFLGRTFTAEEDRVAGGAPVAVISHAYWTRRFGGDRSAVGREITVNGVGLTIVGVAPPRFSDIVGQPIELWIPITMQPALMPERPWLESRTTSWILLMGRLAPGVTLARARSEVEAVMTRSIRAHATGDQLAGLAGELRRHPIRVEPGARGFSYYRQAYAPALLTLSVAVGLVLLVVCANVANLLLARATARGREMSVRLAIGAGRRRLLQQLLVESLVLALAGGALGMLVAWRGSGALLRLASAGPSAIPLDVRLDGRVLAYTAAVAVATALLFGLAPALHATRVDLAGVLRSNARAVTGGGRAGRFALGKLLVVAQVALSLLLLVGTGMLVRSMRRVDTVDLGLARDRLLIAEVDAARSGVPGEQRPALMREIVERVSQVPGVVAASYSENGIFSGTESATTLAVEGFTARAEEDTVVKYDDVGPGYFRTIGARLLRGRDFEERDGELAPRVAVVNETMARFYFANGDALGRHLHVDSATYEIVGVVADVRGQGVREKPDRRLYIALPQLPPATRPGVVKMEIRTAGDPARAVQAVRRALLGARASLVVLRVDPLEALVRDDVSQDRMVARVVAFFGALALGLASLGLYGVMAYATLRRTGEFGLRLALGARAGDVSRLVLRDALVLVAGGVVLGLPAALAGASVLRSQLFGVDVIDAPSIALAVAALTAAAALAAYLPAARAARVAPLEALRAE